MLHSCAWLNPSINRLSALGSALMSIAFFIAKAVVMAQGRNIDCGCFGAFIGLLVSESILMDVPMLFFALVVMRAPDQTRHWDAIGMFIPSPLKNSKISIIIPAGINSLLTGFSLVVQDKISTFSQRIGS
jgi:hypothetical protein